MMSGYNFTERVRRTLALAREEANLLRHEYVGTEHLLLAILREGEGVANTVLGFLGADPDRIRETILNVVKSGNASTEPRADLPYTSRAKKTLELAMSEARELNHAYVGTEHLLLGLIREDKGIAAQVLKDAGITLDIARDETRKILGAPAGEHARTTTSKTTLRATAGPPQYAERLRQVITAAHDLAASHNAIEVTPIHATIALLEHGEGIANAALDALRFNRVDALQSLHRLIVAGTDTIGPEDVLSPSAALTVVLQSMDARQRPTATPGTQHLLMSILMASPDVSAVFAEQSITLQTLQDTVKRLSG